MGAPKGHPHYGGGRKKGQPNKVTADLRAMILNALEAAGGEQYLQAQAIENPAAFMSLVGRTLPKDIKLDPAGALKLTISLSKNA